MATEINSVEGNTVGSSLIALPKQRINKSPAPPGTRSSLDVNNTNATSQKKRGRHSTSPDTRIQAQKAGLGKFQQNRKGKDSLPRIKQKQEQTGEDSVQSANINSANEPETDSCLEEKQELSKVDTVLVLPPPPKSYKDAYAPHRGNAPSNKKIFKSPPPKISNASQNYIEGCTAAFSLPRNKILEAIAPRGKGKTKSTLSIRELSFKGFFMSDSGLSGLAAALSTRNLKNGKAAMPNLKSLSVADNGLTDASSVSITQILNHCPRLTKLDVSSNTKLGLNVARALVAHNILNGASQGLKSKSKKGELPVLTSPLSILEMSGCSKMAKEYVLTIRSLMTRPKHTRPKYVMRELDVSYCNLGDKEGQALCQIIRRWPRAKKINIGYNMFGPRTGLSLSSALQKHKGLDEIIASKNNFGDDAGVAIAFAIAVNASIRVFELEWCGLGPNAAAAMADALMMSPTIVKLNISHNPIGPQGAATLVKAVSVAANVQAEHSRLAKLQFIQQEKEKELAKEQNKHNRPNKKMNGATGKKKQIYKMKPGAMAILASVRFDKGEKKNKRLRGDVPIELVIGKVGPTMEHKYLHNAWSSSKDYAFDLSRPGHRYAMEVLRQRGLHLGAKLRNCIVDEFNNIRPPSKKNDPCWGNKLPTAGICTCIYVSQADVVEKKRKEDLKEQKKLEKEREPPKKMTTKQIKALELKRIQREEGLINGRQLNAVLTPRAIEYIKELEKEGHLAKDNILLATATAAATTTTTGVGCETSVPHLISHMALPFLETLNFHFDVAHASDRTVIHKLLQHAQHIASNDNNVAEFWKINNFQVGGKAVRNKKILHYANHGMPHPDAVQAATKNNEILNSVVAMIGAKESQEEQHEAKEESKGKEEEKNSALGAMALFSKVMHTKANKDACTFDLVVAHNFDRIHVMTIAMDLALETTNGKHVFRTLHTRQMHHPGEKWWCPTPRTIKTAAALSVHPGCSGESLSHGPNIPHVKNLKLLYTVTTGANTTFKPTLQREKYTFDLEDDLQHHFATHLLERCEAHQCYQEWIVEAKLEEEHLPPLVVADMFGMGGGRKHLPMRGTLSFVFVYLRTEPVISKNEFDLFLGEIRAQERDLDRKTLISESVSRGLDLEHVAAMVQPFVHIDNLLESLESLLERGCFVSQHAASLVTFLTTLNKVSIQGIARYIKQIACRYREVETFVAAAEDGVATGTEVGE